MAEYRRWEQGWGRASAQADSREGRRIVGHIGVRVAEISLKDEYPARITKIGAFGGIMTQHDRIQDIDLIVTLESRIKRNVTEADRLTILKALKGKLPALKQRCGSQPTCLCV